MTTFGHLLLGVVSDLFDLAIREVRRQQRKISDRIQLVAFFAVLPCRGSVFQQSRLFDSPPLEDGSHFNLKIYYCPFVALIAIVRIDGLNCFVLTAIMDLYKFRVER